MIQFKIVFLGLIHRFKALASRKGCERLKFVKQEMVIEILANALPNLKSRYPIHHIELFGSVARNTNSELKRFKKSRCDEEQVAVRKPARERRCLRDQAGCGLERSSSCTSVLAFGSAFCDVHSLCGLNFVY
jgi:hypothetical protein